MPPSTVDTNWKSLLLAALHRNRSDKGVRFLQLATVDRDNRPRNRTVVFRGFAEGTRTIMLAVDSRSEKLEQLSRNPHAAICWYFSKTREQFRLTGTITIVTASGESKTAEQPSSSLNAGRTDTQPETSNLPSNNLRSQSDTRQQAIRRQLWSRLSEGAKLLWYWPCPKGDRALPNAFAEQPPSDSDRPPNTFVLLLFDASEIDWLQLKGEPQNRTIFTHHTDGWQARAVNP